jgi:fatty-acyl-CoA synthase
MSPPPYRDVTVGDLLTQLSRDLRDRDALLYQPGPRYTFAALEEEARTIARGLMSLGITRGERIAIWATNVPEWIVVQFAAAKIGAILVTVNTSLRARDIDYVLRQSGATTMITIQGFRDVDYVAELTAIGAFAGRIPALRHLIYIGDTPPKGALPFDALRSSARSVSDADLDARSAEVTIDDVINMQYTSGTTGFPKGVMLSSRNIVNNGCALGEVLGYTPGDRLCLCVPLFHCFGCSIGVLGTYTHGGCICPVEAFDPRRVLETIHRQRCTVLHGVPTMFIAEMECADFERFDLTSLRTGVMAGALCPEPLMRRVMTDMHLPEIIIAYGMTESSPCTTATPRDATMEQRSQTVGVVLPDLEVKIIDTASGVPVAPGERGELCCRGYNVMKGYHDNPEGTRAAVDSDGWLHTGDEASMDADGYIRITGRIKDLIIRGGENIAPKEIEDRLRQHSAVADAYVYGLADSFFGEVVAAAVRLKPASDAKVEDLVAWCAATLAKFKVPKHVRFVDEFPMTASGKVQKFRLREVHEVELSS